MSNLLRDYIHNTIQESFLDIELSPSNSLEDRLNWIGDKFIDLCEGLVGTRELGNFILSVVASWMDLCTEFECQQYRNAYNQYKELLDIQFPQD